MDEPRRRLEGKIAIVTGSGKGIGRAEIVMMADQGAKVVVNDIGFDEGLGRAESVALEIRSGGGEAVVSTDDIATFDLYSCFPFPVFVACEALGVSGDDPRGLTLTGGLPYFGGPGNSYSLHAIAETVAEMREKPGRYGLVGANGGTMSKYSVGIYSTLPVDWRSDRSSERNDEIASLPTVSATENREPSASSLPMMTPVRTGQS